MCTVAILFEVVAGAPLVIAANRDELYARPTRPPESLGDRIAGGVDVLSGGTWLAVRHDGRFAAVTNQRALAPLLPGLRSRGLAVRELATAGDPGAYVTELDPTRYASMNLVWGDARGVSIAYARREGALDIERLPRGIHVLCNDRLGAAGFPRGARLHDAIARAPLRWPDLVPALCAALADHTRAELEGAPAGDPAGAPGDPAGDPAGDPDRALPSAHLPPDVARELTATCIHAGAYGTRSSTIFAAEPGRALAYLHADGPPCTAPFTDRRALL
jgi:uncharacterized protein with NRDE domain